MCRGSWMTVIAPIPVLYMGKSLEEKAMAPHSSTLAWKIPWMEEPGRLQSMGSWRVGHDWTTSLSLFTFHFHALEKEMTTHSSVLAWRIPGTGKPGGLPSMGSHRVGHVWSDLAAIAACILESKIFCYVSPSLHAFNEAPFFDTFQIKLWPTVLWWLPSAYSHGANYNTSPYDRL